MRPAFLSTKGAVGFATLMLALLLLPLIAGEGWLRPREEIYSSLPWSLGPYAYLHNQIYEEKGDIDVAFMGPSSMWSAIDTPYFQKELTEKLGRPAVARTLCWNWVGADAFYRITRDVLEHRKVHMIVFCDMTILAANTPHPMASSLFRWPERGEDLAGLQLHPRAAFYGAAVLGMPKNLLGRLRSNLPPLDSAEFSSPNHDPMPNPFGRLGALSYRHTEGRPFVEFAPATIPDKSNFRIYGQSTKASFRTPPRIQPMQAEFVRKLAQVAHEHGIKMVYLYLPRIDEIRSETIMPNAYWPDAYKDDLTIVGMPPSQLYAGLSDDAVRSMYWEHTHLNENGQRFFTRVVTPELVQIYGNDIQR